MKYQNEQPFYDHLKSYDENYNDGPFGLFRETPQPYKTKYKTQLFGFDIDIPFGIPAGPLLNSRFIKAAWNWGFSV